MSQFRLGFNWMISITLIPRLFTKTKLNHVNTSVAVADNDPT